MAAIILLLPPHCQTACLPERLRKSQPKKSRDNKTATKKAKGEDLTAAQRAQQVRAGIRRAEEFSK